MPEDDYGYFGKGLNGYAHYMLANEGNSKRGRQPTGGKGGCLTTLAFFTLGAVLLLLILL